MNRAESPVLTLVAGGVNVRFPTCHAQYKALGSGSRAFGHALSMQAEYAVDGAKLGWPNQPGMRHGH